GILRGKWPRQQRDFLTDHQITARNQVISGVFDEGCKRAYGEVARVVGHHEIERIDLGVRHLNEQDAVRANVAARGPQILRRTWNVLKAMDERDEIKCFASSF